MREATGEDIRVQSVARAGINFDSQAMLAQALDEEGLLPDTELTGIDRIHERAKPEWFRDPRHLSRVGAVRVTRGLWNDPGFREPLLESPGLTPLEDITGPESAA